MAEKNVISIKPNFIQGLRKLTYYVLKEQFNEEDINIIINKYGIDETIIKKFISYLYNYPTLLIYFNKYLNSLWVKNSLIDFLKSYHYILKMNNIRDSKNFFYFKSSDQKDYFQIEITSLMDNFFQKTYSLYLSNKELRFFYTLFLNGIITDVEISEIDFLINNGTKTIKNLRDEFKDAGIKIIEDEINTTELIKNTVSKNNNISLLFEKLYENKINACSNCKFFKNNIGPIDGNIITDNSVDILLVNLFPNKDDDKRNKLFKDDGIIRKQIECFSKERTWMMYNLIPCVFKNKSEIGTVENIKIQQNQCSVVLDNIKKINANIIILIGEEVFNYFYPDKDFTSEVGNLIDNKFLPVLHPASMRNPKAQLKGKEIWNNVQELIKNLKKEETLTSDLIAPIIELPNDQLSEDQDTKNVTSIVRDDEKELEEVSKIEQVDTKTNIKKVKNKLLLLDIKELSSGEILIVYTDETGKKFYEKKPNKQIGFIKNDDYKNCSILTTAVDFSFNMTKEQKWSLIKKLRSKLNSLKNVEK